MDKKEARLLNPLTLAYMGDAVLDQRVRAHIILKLRCKPNRLHQEAKKFVSAKSQAASLKELQEITWFNEDEQAILQRGRNAKSYTKAKNTDIQTYRKSSALEAVIGYLYFSDEQERLDDLLARIINQVEEREGLNE